MCTVMLTLLRCEQDREYTTLYEGLSSDLLYQCVFLLLDLLKLQAALLQLHLLRDIHKNHFNINKENLSLISLVQQ